MTSFAIYLHSVTCRVLSFEEGRKFSFNVFRSVLNPLIRILINVHV